MHNDFTSYTWPPSVQALHMLVNECEGGESTVVDGFALLNELRSDHPDKFDVLCRVPVPSRIFSEEYECYAANPMVALDSDGEVRMIRFNTAQMQAIPLSEPRLGEFYAAYHELSRRVNDPGAQVNFRLEGGQILLCAGHRVLHGRTALRSTGNRHLQDAYFEHDNVRKPPRDAAPHRPDLKARPRPIECRLLQRPGLGPRFATWPSVPPWRSWRERCLRRKFSSATSRAVPPSMCRSRRRAGGRTRSPPANGCWRRA